MIKSIAIHHHLFNIPATPSLFLVASAMPGLWKGDKAGWPGECGVYRHKCHKPLKTTMEIIIFMAGIPTIPKF